MIKKKKNIIRQYLTVFNGEKLNESEYLAPSIETNSYREFDVPEGCVFVLGDNRENSLDARYWKDPYIDIKNIEGKYICKLPF